MNISRKKTLMRLINFGDELDLIKSELTKFGWDSEEELVILTSHMMKRALERVALRDISFEYLQNWANILECREDIGYEEESFDLIKEIISEVANPQLYGNITLDKIQTWIKKLEN